MKPPEYPVNASNRLDNLHSLSIPYTSNQERFHNAPLGTDNPDRHSGIEYLQEDADRLMYKPKGYIEKKVDNK